MPDNQLSQRLLATGSVAEKLSWFIRHLSDGLYIDGLVQERCNSIANALELRLSSTNPWICSLQTCEISHRTFGPGHRKCLMCLIIFVNTEPGFRHRYKEYCKHCRTLSSMTRSLPMIREIHVWHRAWVCRKALIIDCGTNNDRECTHRSPFPIAPNTNDVTAISCSCMI